MHVKNTLLFTSFAVMASHRAIFIIIITTQLWVYRLAEAQNVPVRFNAVWKEDGHTLPIQGYSPPGSAGETFPVYLWIQGTEQNFNTSTDQDLTYRMSTKGYVSAQCKYGNVWYPLTCEGFLAKAKAMFDLEHPESCLSVLCSQPQADCAQGVAVHGFSQGAQLASLSSYVAKPLVTAAYLQGNGNQADNYVDISSCVNYYETDGSTRNPFHALPNSKVRSVAGEHDEHFGCCYDPPDPKCCDRRTVHTQQHNTTGLDCEEGQYDCLQPDGSGWYIVSDAQAHKGIGADHCYMYVEGTCIIAGEKWNPQYLQDINATSCPWCLEPCLDWLSHAALTTTEPPNTKSDESIVVKV